MIDQIFSWATLLTVVGLVGFWFARKKKWWCWYINIGCQVLWFTYAIVSQQYAFIAASLAYTFVFSMNAIEWTREHFENYVKPDPNAKVIGHVEKVINDSSGLSVQFKIDNDNFVDGVRTVQEAHITALSIFGPPAKKRKWWRRWK